MFADDFEEQFLLAACPSANPTLSRVVVTANGPGVRHKPGSVQDVVLFCQVHADASNFFNWLQLVAEDNTPDAYAQATLWRMDTVSPGAACAVVFNDDQRPARCANSGQQHALRYSE